MFMMSPISLSVVGDVLRSMLEEVVAVVLRASWTMGCERSCAVVRFLSRVEENPQ